MGVCVAEAGLIARGAECAVGHVLADFFSLIGSAFASVAEVNSSV